MKTTWMALLLTAALAVQAHAADETEKTEKSSSSAPMAKDQPIDISSDALDVLQDQHKAIFTGNVIATQGTTNMRSKKMTVYYHDANSGEKNKNGESAQGISRIDAEGDVLFTTPQETAKGDFAVYHVENNTIDLTGANVTLTRDKNILKGTHMIHNMTTGRSVLTSGNGATVSGGKPARVHGLFVPKAAEKPAEKTPAKTTDAPAGNPKAN